MKIRYDRGKNTVQLENKDPSILRCNRIGGFYFFSPKPKSRYNGFGFHDRNEVFKTLESIDVKGKIKKISDRGNSHGIERENGKEELYLSKKLDALHYKSNVESKLSFDCRFLYDDREWGREYKVKINKDSITICFAKKNDGREDNGKYGEYELFCTIVGNYENVKVLDEWKERKYSWDEKRNAPPCTRWVYEAVLLKAKDITLAHARTEEKSRKLAKQAHKNRKKTQLPQIKTPKMPKNLSMAYKCAITSINELLVDDGIFAGLPWFFQFWSRDTAISLYALNLIGKKKESLKIFEGLLHSEKFSGSLTKSMYGGEKGTIMEMLDSIDGVGWTYVRASQLLNQIDKKQLLKRLDDVLKDIFSYYLRDGLVYASPLTTWMDTEWDGDNREGCCIEIQALTLAMLKLKGQLSGEDDSREQILRENTRKAFWNEEYLSDLSSNDLIRPNIFIAYYAYPELLSKTEWKTCFNNSLKKLWLEWGGLASIDINNSLFTKNSTGQKVQSYHRGDSWYWINNLAALCMYRVDSKHFKKKIDKIIKASVKNILEQGATGCHSEISSASQHESEGCQNQAWSAAMFIELIQEMYG